MKRLTAVLLVAVLLFGLTACAANDKSDDTTPLREVGTYEEGVKGFYDIQSEMYDYFLHLIGFGHITVSDDTGKFADRELIQFAVLQLSFSGEDLDAGLTERQLERTTTRYLSQVPTRLEGAYLTYDEQEDVYRPTSEVKYEIGALMCLETMTVNADGVCTADFRRAKWPQNYGEGRTDEEIKQDFLNGWYEGLDEVQRIRMIFRERDTAAHGYYIEVMNIQQLPDQ